MNAAPVATGTRGQRGARRRVAPYSLGGERACARGVHRLGETAEIVRAVVASAVDEKGGRAGDVAAVGALDVLGNAVTRPVRFEFIAEAVDLEAELLCVADQIARGERVLVGEEEIMHCPEGTLRRGGLGRFGGQPRVRVNVAKWKV